MKWWPAECVSGDMIRVRIGGIWHYGVYVSDDEVIQFGPPPRCGAERPETIRVCSTTMSVFSGGSLHIWLPKAHPVAPAPASARVITTCCTITASILPMNAFSASKGASRKKRQGSNGTNT